MAKFEWKGDDEMRIALERSTAKFPGICQAMLRAAAQYILFELQMANATFQKFWKAYAPKQSKTGWTASISPKGKTSSGAAAALALSVNEYGRGGKRPQPARPFVRQTLKDSEEQVQIIMQNEYDKYMREITRV